jgi:hypothetical protein
MACALWLRSWFDPKSGLVPKRTLCATNRGPAMPIFDIGSVVLAASNSPKTLLDLGTMEKRYLKYGTPICRSRPKRAVRSVRMLGRQPSFDCHRSAANFKIQIRHLRRGISPAVSGEESKWLLRDRAMRGCV